MKIKLTTLRDLAFAKAIMRAREREHVTLYWRVGPVREQSHVTPAGHRGLPVMRMLNPDRQENPFMFTLTDSQQTVVAVDPRDKRNNAAQVENVRFAVSDPNVLSVEADPSNPLSATVKALGPLGTAQVQVTADSRLGDEVNDISGILDVEVVAGEAVSLGVTAGPATEQP